MTGGQLGVRAMPAVLGCAGLVCVVIGTFLPWLYSGSHTRNSYATDGAVRELLGVHGLGGAALAAWPFVGFACGAAIAALLLHLVRTAALLALLAAAAAAAGAITMLTTDSAGGIKPADIGPIVTFVGSMAVPAAISMHVIISFRLNRRHR